MKKYLYYIGLAIIVLAFFSPFYLPDLIPGLSESLTSFLLSVLIAVISKRKKGWIYSNRGHIGCIHNFNNFS